MKSVLISIRPEWCEKIANGIKTLEIRKTRPKIDTPFKCYIYCTKNGAFMERDIMHPANFKNRIKKYGGKVIGEFVCDWADIFFHSKFCVYRNNPDNYHCNIYPIDYLYNRSCLDYNSLFRYIGEGYGYAWHISNLVIYDKPKELSEFGIKRPPQSWQYIDEVRGN